jgi:hypothetical protein
LQDSILQKFLDAGMLNIGEGDEKFEALQSASEDLSKILEERKSEVIRCTLVAVDPKIPSSDPTLGEIETVVKGHWKTLRNLFPDTPRRLLQIVALDAIYSAGIRNPQIASITWLTGTSYLPFSALETERRLYTDLFLHLGNIAEERAIEEWASHSENTPLNFPSFPESLPNLEGAAVDIDELTKGMFAAAGPADNTGQPIQNRNPNWPSGNNPWVQEFGTRAAKAIATSINSSNSIQIDNISKNLAQVYSEYSSSFNTAINALIEKMRMKTSVDATRTALLWWKEALYSPSTRRGYRSFKPEIAAFIMAYDLHEQVPVYCPQAVEFFLREAVQEVVGTSEPVYISKILDELRSEGDLGEIKKGLSTRSNEDARIPMLDLAENILAGSAITNEQGSTIIGVDKNAKISLKDWSAWIFRDLQARRQTNMQG